MSVSLRDFQKCFEKERQVLLHDMEILRQQLVKKENHCKRIEKNASMNAIQLKKEIQTLQNAFNQSKKEAQIYQQKFTHTSSLLENAMDQRQEDQDKIATLTEKLRTFEKRQEETIGMIKREACASINISNEERKFLRTRVDQLRLTLEKEKKESLTNKHTLETDLHKTKGRLQILEKELKESRFREHSTHQIKEKMISEVALYKRKLTEATLTLQQAIEAKTCLKKEYQFTFKKLKNKIKEVEQNHQHTKSEMAMVQEDYAAIFRTRQQILTKNKTLQKEQDLLRQHQQQEIQQREEIIKTLENKQIQLTFVCKNCKTTPEERQTQIREEINQEKLLLKEELAKEFQLERWEKFNAFQLQFIQLTDELQRVGKEKDFLLAQKTSLHSQVETCSHQCTLFEQQNKEFAFKNEELQNKLKEKQAWMEQNEVKIKELMEKINNLSQLNAEQSKQIQELEQLRCVEQERYLTMMETFEMNKKHFLEEKKQLQKQLNDQKKQFEQIQKEKTKQLNEMIEAQLSANLLIEEQAHTIDDLLKSKKPTGTSTTGTCTTIGMTCSNKHDGYHHQYHQKIMELVKTLEKMTKEKENLEKKIEEQALTIHELTLDDDDDEEEEEEEEEEDGYANEDGQEENMEEEIQVKFLRRQKKNKDTIRTWTSPSKERRFKGSGISFKDFSCNRSTTSSSSSSSSSSSFPLVDLRPSSPPIQRENPILYQSDREVESVDHS